MKASPGSVDPVVVQELTTRRRRGDSPRPLSLTIAPGEAVSLLGAPGSGKSELICHILGVNESRRGQVLLFGHRPRSVHARRQVGFAPQYSVLPPFLHLHEIFDFVARHYRDPVRPADLADRFGLTDHLDLPVCELTPSAERLATVALAFIGRPALVVLDEPTADLDRHTQARIRSVARTAHAQGTALLVATHEPAEATALAERVLFMQNGRLVFDGDRSDLLSQVGIRRVSFHTDAPARVGELACAVTARTHGPDTVSVSTNDVDGLLAELATRRIRATDISVRTVSLTEVESLLTDRATV